MSATAGSFPSVLLTPWPVARAQFLDSRDLVVATEPVIAPSRPVAQRECLTPRPPSAVDTVWVDCFYYGFYMEKSKLPAFQASLRQQQKQTALAR